MEFVEWDYALKVLDWERESKLEYYLASIIVQLKSIGEMFAKSPKSFSIKDGLLNFKEEGKTETEKEEELLQEYDIDEQYSSITLGGTKEKWAEVNERAKARWLGWLKLNEKAMEKYGNDRPANP